VAHSSVGHSDSRASRGTVPQWVKLRERNEALDLEVYALAALYTLGPTTISALADRAARLAAPGVAGPEVLGPVIRSSGYIGRVTGLRQHRGGWTWR